MNRDWRVFRETWSAKIFNCESWLDWFWNKNLNREFALATRAQKYKQMSFNRPFPSCLLPLFQTESKCEIFHMKMSMICIRMDLWVKLIFIWKVSHLDSFWNRGKRELGNGLFTAVINLFLSAKFVELQGLSWAGNASERQPVKENPLIWAIINKIVFLLLRLTHCFADELWRKFQQ